MNENKELWRAYYQKTLQKAHDPKTRLAVDWDRSRCEVAVDVGCGVGADCHCLAESGYRVRGFDVSHEAVDICRTRFAGNPSVEIFRGSMEDHDYPDAGVVVANSSLYFADPRVFPDVWSKIERCIQTQGVFAGDFMGVDDSWASGSGHTITVLTKQQVLGLFGKFQIIAFDERNGPGLTSMGRLKHWHTFSVVAVKRD